MHHGTITAMFRNTGILLLLFFAPITVAHGQLLDSVGSVNTTEVTVGTTTFSVGFETARLQSAQSRLQQILYYLQAFDSDTAIENALQGVGYAEVPSTYNTVIDTAFETPSVEHSDAFETINNLATSEEGACFVFSQDLEIGDTGPEVHALQKFLNQSVGTQVAASGPGSPGEETDYFGSLTLSAVFAFQDQYRADILEPLGLTSPTGYWGPSSIAHANRLQGCE